MQLKRLVTVDRAHFEFNPTELRPMQIDGTLTGYEGASAAVSSPFQVAGCASLPFAPEADGHGGARPAKRTGRAWT